jgi:N-acetylglutamate synthase-like GNAT family acetyltransferase
VAGPWRGPAHGVAAGLLRRLLDHAEKQGFARIWLGTTDAFKAAHKFYEKHGFQQVEPDPLPPGFPRMAVDTRFYRLDVL